MSDNNESLNPFAQAMREGALDRARKQLKELHENWSAQGASASTVPISVKDINKPGRDWLPETKWMSGGDAFMILRLQTEPYEDAPAIARICQIIADQWDRDQMGLNYALSSLPPSHELLANFNVGSAQWFRALHSLLSLTGADSIDGWERLVGDLFDWIVFEDCLRIRTSYVLDNALEHHWSIHKFSLPEAKQQAVWSFPTAMAWIATRDYLALARIGRFRRAEGAEEPVATDGVCKYNTAALGWLHTEIAFAHCKCGALHEFGLQAFQYCTCISVAWEELVQFSGGLSPETPELVFGIQEGWLSMTWPDRADKIRFLRRDILERWPEGSVDEPTVPENVPRARKRPGPAPDPDWPHAIAKVTQDCIAAGYKRTRKRGDKAAIQTMLLNFMSAKGKHFSDDIAAKHAERVIAALPDN